VALLVVTKLNRTPPPSEVEIPRTASVPETLPTPNNPTEGAGAGLSADDIAFLNALFTRIKATPTAAPGLDELQRVATLLAAHPDDSQLKAFLVSLYFRRATEDLQRRAFSEVDQSLGRLKVLTDSPEIYSLQAESRGAQGDWAGVEESIRAYEGSGGRESLAMTVNLAVSIRSQGRTGDALVVLERPIFASCTTAVAAIDQDACRVAEQLRAGSAPRAADAPADAGPDAVAERPRAQVRVDPSKSQIQSDRFDVRFDGEAQSGVARDVLFVLDRAYVRLRDIYYEEPTRKIPVVLHSSQDYYTQTGAPWWSGGVYSSHDGAIQIPIRGLPRDLPREMEDVLVHELSHAFVDEMSGGFAGRDLQEGLAQYMEGKRIEDELGPAELKRLANARSQTVMSFYMLALVVTQQMVQSRGQGVINQLLKAMRDAHSEDGGYQKTFGRSGSAMKQDILETFWRRYS